MSATHPRQHRITIPAPLRSYTPDEAAAATGLNLDQLRRMRNNGQGPAYLVIGKRTVRYIRADVDQWRHAADR